ncbi:MAG TPA: HAD hydrolase-like protein [Candidatus Bathyarchaeia archaeon]|nr:HAD hydrolase-like protein [Candidatus Bathyarchaeia archaeon]
MPMTITTVLFDMDSTLNEIDEIAFSRKYFKTLHDVYFNYLDAQFFYETLTEITRTVMLSKLPKELCIRTFMKEMSKYFKRTPKKLYETFKAFYSNEYNELESFIKPAKFSREAVKACFDNNMDVIVATTPIFTETAIIKRLYWSGVADFNFKLITHAENMHFSKPREEYYWEILKKIKRTPVECIMVGNEFMGDIVGPSKIGISTFYCPHDVAVDDLFVSPELKRFSKYKPNFVGSLEDFIKLLENGFNQK